MIGMLVFAGVLAASSATEQPATAPAPAPVAAPASTAPAAVPAAPALASNVAPAAPDKAKLICETEEETGSRLIKHKTCLTADQWREMRRQERLDVEHDQRIGRKGN